MFTVYKYTLKRFTGQILGWGIAFGLVSFYLMAIYTPMIDQHAEIQRLFDAYGETMLAFFGGGADFLSPAGFLDFTMFSYLPVVAGIFAVLLGSGLLAADEEKGVLDLVLAHPISRSELFWGRLLAFASAVALILGFTWLGFVLGLPLVEWDVNAWTLLLPHLALLALLLLYGAVALLMSMLLPSRGLAASLSGALMVASYLVKSLASIFDQLEPLDQILPMRYYQGGYALNGLEWGNLLGLLGFTLLFTLLAWLLFQRRDIRVSGEGSWRT